MSPTGSTRSAALALADAAVAAGLDTLWLGDGLLRNDGDFPTWAGALEPFTELAWLAGRHPGARVGVTAAVLPNRDIDGVVRQICTLDQLTEGQVVVAVTPGFWDEELVWRGLDPARRGAEFRARLARLRALLAEGVLAPAPFGPVALWLAGAGPTMRTAVALGLPFQASRARPEELAPVAGEFFDGGGTVLAHRTYLEAGDHAVDGVRVARHTLTGSPAALVDALGRYQQLGVADLSLVLGHDDASSRATLDVLATDVLPQLSSY